LATKPLETREKAQNTTAQNFARLNDIFSQIGVKKKAKTPAPPGNNVNKGQRKQTSTTDIISNGRLVFFHYR
jgi:spore germination protein YaaH